MEALLVYLLLDKVEALLVYLLLEKNMVLPDMRLSYPSLEQLSSFHTLALDLAGRHFLNLIFSLF